MILVIINFNSLTENKYWSFEGITLNAVIKKMQLIKLSVMFHLPSQFVKTRSNKNCILEMDESILKNTKATPFFTNHVVNKFKFSVN